ncbi:uncharacterized protein DNG_02544 [Cephalotrichum gorgonifer]|uniref:Uncharacterized protein n=1 Tax=Cephalotrichum gorgonifer TaxID=2041049 RepID=A0AAE8MSM3_9PEZI|nr:uncharacterized protein DNG_02544 [Cephalotrichum gorgonifer]
MVATAHGTSLDGGEGIFRRRSDSTDIPFSMSEGQVDALKLISLCVSTVSVFMALVTFYWFLRMRRSFRHDLIMLLIQSDMFKALWFMIFPIVDFLHGPVQSSSTFCQVSGFFLTVGIESSDVAVLLIAIHTALYILNPKRARGEYGLYPYRRLAYAVFFAFPILMASLAFINSPTGYQNMGEYCYLPPKPSWPKAFLSWLPRWVILIAILITYAFLYIYVSRLMKRFSQEGPKTNHPAKLREQHARRSSDPCILPPVYQGFVASSRRQSYDVRDRQNSVSTLTSFDFEPARTPCETTPLRGDRRNNYTTGWKWLDLFPADPASSSSRQDPNSSSANLFDTGDVYPTTLAPAPKQPEDSVPPGRLGGFPLPLPEPVGGSQSHDHISAPYPRAAAESTRRPSYSSTIFSNIFTTVTVPVPDGDLPNMKQTRHKILQKIRLLFIYPLVYVVIWILPFISHVFTWSHGGREAPFAIRASALVSLCIQGAVNSLLFSVWEKPWRHVRGNGSPGWGGAGEGAMVGRTREEMMVDGRIARTRLGVEIEERMRNGQPRAKRRNMDWWDLFDVEESLDGNGGPLTR